MYMVENWLDLVVKQSFFSVKNFGSQSFRNCSERLRDSDLVHSFKDGTKLKIPSEINPPLNFSLQIPH